MSDQDSVEAMKERKIRSLTQKNEERKLKLEQRKESKASQSHKEENNCVLDKFEQLEKEIKALLTQIEDVNVPKESLPELFDSSFCKLEEWQKMISLTSHILRIYHKKQFQVKYHEMNDKRMKLEQSLIPQKKFSFSKRNTKNETGDKELLPNVVQDEPDVTTAVEKPVKKYVLKLDDEYGYFQRENENFVLKHEEIFKKDVAFRDLKKCQIRMDGGANTVHFVSLTDCLVLCGPVSTSIFVDKCSNCTFVVACQQLRVHHTFETDFYVHVTSRAIIEDCKDVRFAPYNWNYDGIEEHFKKINLDKAVNNWNLINDFNWLSAVPSPNWKIIEETKEKQSGTELIVKPFSRILFFIFVSHRNTAQNLDNIIITTVD